jgi:hypothetical protein
VKAKVLSLMFSMVSAVLLAVVGCAAVKLLGPSLVSR